MSTLARRLSIVAGILVLAGSFALSRYLGSQKQEPERKTDTKRVTEVEVMTAVNQKIASTLEVQGRLTAFERIELYAEVGGLLKETERPFKVGTNFPKGSVLCSIDDTEARLTLLAQKSSLLNAVTQMMPDLKIDYPESYKNWKLYLDEFNPEKPVPAFPQPLNQQEKYFVASRNLHNAYYSIKSAEERLGKYLIRSPFNGTLIQVSIYPGAVVRVGQKLGELMSTGNYELEATVTVADLQYVRVGSRVKLVSGDIGGQWSGTVRRIGDQVDPGTQTVKVFIGVSGANLRDGMYLRGEVEASSIENALQLPRELLVNQESVYEVRDSQLHLRPVTLVKMTSEFAIIRGIENGAVLLKNKPAGIFDGMKVRIKDTTSAQDEVTSNQ